MEVEFFFMLASSKLTVVNIYFKNISGSGSRSQIISAPLAPTPQYCMGSSFCLFSSMNGRLGIAIP